MQSTRVITIRIFNTQKYLPQNYNLHEGSRHQVRTDWETYSIYRGYIYALHILPMMHVNALKSVIFNQMILISIC